jgi:hypothetical protein
VRLARGERAQLIRIFTAISELNVRLAGVMPEPSLLADRSFAYALLGTRFWRGAISKPRASMVRMLQCCGESKRRCPITAEPDCGLPSHHSSSILRFSSAAPVPEHCSRLSSCGCGRCIGLGAPGATVYRMMARRGRSSELLRAARGR